MKKMCVPAVLLFFCTASAQVVVNISLPERGGTYIDVVRENYRWNAIGTGNALDASNTDSAGWPEVDARHIIDWRPVAEWAGSIDDPEASPHFLPRNSSSPRPWFTR